MANKLEQLKVGDRCPVHLHLDTVLGEVIGFVPGKVILHYTYKQLHADGWHYYSKDFYRDIWQVERQHNDWVLSSK